MAPRRNPNSFVFKVLNVILAEGAVGQPKGLKGKVILRKLGRKPTTSGQVQVSTAVRILRRDYGLPILNGQSPEDGYWLGEIPADMLSTISRFLEVGSGLRETRQALEGAQERLALSEQEVDRLLTTIGELPEPEEE